MSDLQLVDAVVSGDIWIPGLRAKPLERLRQKLWLKNPEWTRAKRRGAETGSTPEMIDVLFEEPDGSVRIPRGANELVRASLAEDLLRPKWIDKRSWGEELVFDQATLDRALLKKPPRFYQDDGAAEMARSLQGTIVIPCGGGKTTLGAVGISRLRRTAIILVHTEDLLDQWVETVRFWLGIEPGTVIAGKANPGPVTVAMVISLANLLDSSEGEAFGRRFGVAIVDECHHAPAPETFQRALRKLPCRVRVGLTATPEREDGLTDLMDWTFGRRLLEVDAKLLFARGWLTAPSVERVESDFRFEYKLPDKPDPKAQTKRLAKLQKAIVNDSARNLLIARRAAAEFKAGETVVILSNHKAHCRALGRLCWEHGAEAAVLISKGTKAAKQARKDTLQGMRDGKVRLIIATSLFDEGVDVERLSRVILALPESSKRGTNQRLGRLMRNWPGKRPKLIDIVDPHVETLVRRAEERTRVYKKLGLDH